MTKRRLISTGSPMEKLAGYSRAVVQGDFVHVSGTTGFDYSTMTMPEDVVAQTRNALETIKKALGEADSCLEDIVRGRYYLASADDVDAVFAIMGEYFGDIRPAATMVICGLVSPEMRVEIEVTAQKQA